MEKTKINILQSDYPVKVQEVTKLTKEIRRAFMYLLSSEKMEEEQLFLEQDDKAQQEFNNFIDDYENGECFFVGFQGTGKSAFLYNYFHLISGQNYWIHEDTLFVYFGRNSIIEYRNVGDSLIEELADLCKYLESEYGITNDHHCDLYDFIVNTKRSVMRNPYLSRKKNNIEDYIAELKNLKKEKKMTFVLMRLKFYLLHNIKHIKRIILVFDCIEDKRSFSELYKKIYDCMLNYNRNVYQGGYHVKAIYTIRPSDFRIITQDCRNFVSIQKDVKMDIQKLFDKRCNFAMSQDDIWWTDKGFGKKELKFAQEKLEDLNTKFNQKYQKMIRGLSFYDINKALECYKTIVFNVTWVQKERFQYGDDEDSCVWNSGFLFDNITCIRALACKNEQVYQGNITGGIIPNILYSTEDEDYSIYVLLIMKYFVRSNNVKDFLGGESGKTFSEVLKMCEDIFGRCKEYTNFEKAIQYMYENEILKKSVDPNYSRDGENLTPESRLYISAKGAELWDMLRGDSVLMEICREDYYRSQNGINNFEPSYKLISSKKQRDIFEDLLLMIEDFKRQENVIFASAKKRGKIDELEKTFGKRRMTYFLLEGVNKSILYSSSRSNDHLKMHKTEVEQLVNERI